MVLMGAVTVPVRGAHHSAVAVGGAPALMSMEMIDLPPPPPGQAAPPSVDITKCVPFALVYAVGEVLTFMAPPVATVSVATALPIPPKFWALSRYSLPSL